MNGDNGYDENKEEENDTMKYFPLHALCSLKDISVDTIKKLIAKHPKAVEQRDQDGLLPIHYAAEHGSLDSLHLIYESYRDGIKQIDEEGRLPLHLALQNENLDSIEFLIEHHPEGAFTEVKLTKNSKSAGDLPLHTACQNRASVNVINILLSSNFVSAQKLDKDGNLPIHIILRRGEVERAAIKSLLAFYPQCISCTDCEGNLPLTIALTSSCSASVIETLISEYPVATQEIDSFGSFPLFLALEYDAADRIVMKLIDYNERHVSVVDSSAKMLPIQMATEKERSHFIVYQLLLRDMPFNLNEKDQVSLNEHKGSWFHLISNTFDKYYPVIQKVLSQCTQGQVVALANLRNDQGNTAYEVASPVCRYEIRVAMRLFETLEVTETKPAYSSPISETQILYGLRYSPRSAISFNCDSSNNSGENVISLDNLDDVESVETQRSFISNWSQSSIEERINEMRDEKGQQVIVKFTSRRDIMEREIGIRSQFRLSRLYVAPVLSVHSTVQKDVQGFCITMEGADMTLENMLNDRNKYERHLNTKTLKKIAVSLLHIHERGLVHCDFGSHNIGKFGNRWKILGIGGSARLGGRTDVNRGFYYPPESVKLTTERKLFIKKTHVSSSISVVAHQTYDIWAFGLMLYEVVKGKQISMYAQKGQIIHPSMMVKIGKWNERAMKKALKGIAEKNSDAYDLLTLLLQADPKKRLSSMREVLQHPFFERSNEKSNVNKRTENEKNVDSQMQDPQDMQHNRQLLKSLIESSNVV